MAPVTASSICGIHQYDKEICHEFHGDFFRVPGRQHDFLASATFAVNETLGMRGCSNHIVAICVTVHDLINPLGPKGGF